MNRREFVQLGALGALALPSDGQAPAAHHDSSKLRRVMRHDMKPGALGFPTVTPLFAGIFLPGGKQTQTISANGWTAFSTQVQTLAASGWRLASLSALQNMNQTTFYAALEQGTANYQLVGTADESAFLQAFNSMASGYQLVDFSITWEQGELFYAGYWLAVSTPPQQTLLLNLTFNALVAQWTTLNSQNQRMTRIQAFPSNDSALFAALFTPGTGGYVLYSDSLANFTADVTTKWNGYTLVGVSYDQVDGNMVGCWRDPVAGAQFFFNQSWAALSATAQQLAAQGLILRAMTAYPSAPAWDDYFSANLAPFAEGYAYAVAQNGQIIAANGYGDARGSQESVDANVAFTADVRSNLASVSKPITGIALQALIAMHGLSLDQPFTPLIASMVPNPNPTITKVTLRNLATMMSGLQPPATGEGPLSGDLWPYLNGFLAQPLANTPGVTNIYMNDNFTCLMGVINVVSGLDYVTFVTQFVLIPAGINTNIFNATPDPQNTSALSYNSPSDVRPGHYWGAFNFVAPGGWISSARELVKIPIALRGTNVLPAATVSSMLNGGIGWYSTVGPFGTYFFHDGALTDGGSPPRQLNTCIVRLGEGYDIALVVNCQPPTDVVNICIGAFDGRTLPSADAPPAIASVVHGASFLPKIAPGSFASIIGTGFTDQAASDWSAAIPKSGALPTVLNGISVKVAGISTYAEYAGATQVNFLLPSTVPSGIATVQLTTPNGVLDSTVEVDTVAPGLFSYYLKGVQYAAALIATSATPLYVAATGALAGSASRPAAPGDIIELFASGLGATSPAAPDGVVLTKPYPIKSLSSVQATIGGQAATVQFAGLTYAGLFQVNVVVPSGLPGGDQPVVLTVNGVASQANTFLTMLGG